MLDIDKDIEVEVIINVAGKRRALANLIIGGLIKVSNFEIIQAENKKVYVVNPHIISTVYNKTAYKKEITYLSTASLLDHADRKKLIEKILDRYAEELEKIKIDRSEAGGNRTIASGSRHSATVDKDIKRDYSI